MQLNKGKKGSISWLFLLFLVSFQLRCWYIDGTVMIEPIRADAKLYAILAKSLGSEGSYFPTGNIDTGLKKQLMTRDPGYPFLLAPIAKHAANLRAFFYTTVYVQSLIGAATVCLAFLTARFFLPPFWSGTVALLVMLSPHLISMTNYVLTETIFTFLLQGALLLFLYALNNKRTWLFAASGLALGAAITVRSVLQLFPFVLAAITFYYLKTDRKEAIKKSMLLVITSFIFFIPWKTWSHFTFKKMGGAPSLLQDVLYIGSYIDLTYDNVPEGQPKYGVSMVYRDDPNYYSVVNGGYKRIIKEIRDRFEEDFIGYSTWYIFGKPAMFWSWSMIHAGGDYNVYPVKHTWYDKNPIMNISYKIMKFLHPIIILLMHFGVLLFLLNKNNYSRQQVFIMTILLALTAYFLLIHTILVPVPRYSLPLRPIVYFLAVYGVYRITDLSSQANTDL